MPKVADLHMCIWPAAALGGTSASGPECVKTPGQALAMISENFIAREPHETVYPG